MKILKILSLAVLLGAVACNDGKDDGKPDEERCSESIPALTLISGADVIAMRTLYNDPATVVPTESKLGVPLSKMMKLVEMATAVGAVQLTFRPGAGAPIGAPDQTFLIGGYWDPTVPASMKSFDLGMGICPPPGGCGGTLGVVDPNPLHCPYTTASLCAISDQDAADMHQLFTTLSDAERKQTRKIWISCDAMIDLINQCRSAGVEYILFYPAAYTAAYLAATGRSVADYENHNFSLIGYETSATDRQFFDLECGGAPGICPPPAGCGGSDTTAGQ
jgi:hypothetical protein